TRQSHLRKTGFDKGLREATWPDDRGAEVTYSSSFPIRNQLITLQNRPELDLFSETGSLKTPSSSAESATNRVPRRPERQSRKSPRAHTNSQRMLFDRLGGWSRRLIILAVCLRTR